jgi:two-component system, NtrC family, response regulator HydG
MAYCEKIKSIKVLLVDEDREFTDKMETILEKRNFEYVVSNDMSVGLSMMFDHQFDIIVLDFNMLEPLGDSVVEFLSTVRRLNNQKLVLTTTHLPSVKLTLDIMKQGIDAFVSKPLKVETLYEIINRPDNCSETNANTTFIN